MHHPTMVEHHWVTTHAQWLCHEGGREVLLPMNSLQIAIPSFGGHSRRVFPARVFSLWSCVFRSFLSLEVSLTKGSHNSFPLSGQVPYVGVWREEENYEACWNCCASVWGFDVCVSYHLRTYKSHLLAFLLCSLSRSLVHTHIFCQRIYIRTR